jgi:peptide deformylase
MAVLQIIRLGHPKLREKSRRVNEKELLSADMQQFLDDLAETCLVSNGAGIAAPQVGINKRIIVVHVDPNNPRYPDRTLFPLTIVVNPKVTSAVKEIKEDWEGDLSAGLRALIPRPIHCHVSGMDRYGNPITFNLEDDFHARVFQHEIDHLDGIMFIDRVVKKESLCETAEWEKYWRRKKK